MPADDIYWSPMDFGSEEESVQEMKHYVDPWDLENYAYIRQHLDSGEVSSGPSSDEFTNSASFSYGPVQNYAAIEEVRRYEKPRRAYRDGFDAEFDENPYEVDVKDISISYGFEQKDKWRRRPQNVSPRNHRDRSLSFSYGDYGTTQDIYCRLDEIRPKRESTVPIYDDITRKKPRNFGLSNYGHLKIDYSYSWNTLDKYIYN